MTIRLTDQFRDGNDSGDRPTRMVIVDDCRHVLGGLPNDFVTLTHTSPPYNIGRHYRGFRDSQDIQQYSSLIQDVMDALFRVTRPGGSVFWQTGYTTYGTSSNGCGIMPLDALSIPIAQAAGFHVWDRIVWSYHGSMAFRTKFTNRHETIIWLTKPDGACECPVTFNLDEIRERSKSYDGRNHILGRNPGNVWDSERVAYGSVGQTSHVAVFPEEVCEKIVRSCSVPGDVVLDPFAGSGTLPKVALSLGRQFIACELSEEYAAEADTRLRLWGRSEIENLVLGLMIKYAFHGREGTKSVQQISELLRLFTAADALAAVWTALRGDVEEIVRAPRVTKTIKRKKQDIWEQYDNMLESGNEGNEIIAADRALCYCYAHRRRWNGIRRVLSASSLLIRLGELISKKGEAEKLVRKVCRVASTRFDVHAHSIDCKRVDPGLGCNGDVQYRTKASKDNNEPALWS